MGARDVKAGGAYVEIGGRSAGLDKVLARVESQMKGFQAKLQGVGASLTGIGTRLAAGMSAALAPLALTVKSAADAQELRSKFGAVFGDLAAGAEQWAAKTADAVKRSKSELMASLSTYQSFFVGMGFGKEQSLGLSQTLASLAVDFASFHNIADDDAMSRFIAAMSGSSEVLDQFGVNIKEAAIAQEMLKRASTGNEEMDKTLARLSILQKSLAGQGAIGDAVKTSGSFTNSMKALRGSVSEASTAIGEALLPALTPIVNRLAAASKWAATWAQQNGPLIASVAKVGVIVAGAGVGIAAVGLSLTAIGATVGRAAAGLGVVRTILAGMVSPVGLVVAGVAGLGAYLATTTSVGRTALSALGGYFDDLKATASETFGGIKTALQGGDFTLAAKIMWKGIQLAFAQGIKPLQDSWTAFRKFFVDVAIGAWAGAQAAFEIARNTLAESMIKLTGTLGRIWDSFTNGLKTAFEEAVDFTARLMVEAGVGNLSPEEKQRAREMFTQQNEATKTSIAEDAANAARESLAKERGDLKAEGDRHVAAMAKAGADAIAKMAGNASNAGDEVAKRAGELAALKGEIDALIAKAKTAGTGTTADRFKDAGGILPSAQDIASGIAKSASVAGTFSAFGAGAMGPTRTLDRIAKATEQTAKTLIDWGRGGGRQNQPLFR